MATKSVPLQKQREKLSKETDWNGNFTNVSPELKTHEGRKIIIARIDSMGKKGPERTKRLMCVIQQIERLEYKAGRLESLTSLVLTSGTYAFHNTCDTDEKKRAMIHWDIATLCYHGKAARIQKLNQSLLD
jgi:hypothetical protein